MNEKDEVTGLSRIEHSTCQNDQKQSTTSYES